MASPIEPTPPLAGPDAERLVEELGRGCSPEQFAERVSDARKHLASTFHPNADAHYHDPRDPDGVLRVVRTGEIVPERTRPSMRLDLRAEPPPSWTHGG